MSDTTTTGVLDPGRPGRFLVPPWPDQASFGDIVDHFVWHDLRWLRPSTLQKLAYFEAFGIALETAKADGPASSYQARWREDMRDCVDRCERLYREKLTPPVSEQGSGRGGW